MHVVERAPCTDACRALYLRVEGLPPCKCLHGCDGCVPYLTAGQACNVYKRECGYQKKLRKHLARPFGRGQTVRRGNGSGKGKTVAVKIHLVRHPNHPKPRCHVEVLGGPRKGRYEDVDPEFLEHPIPQLSQKWVSAFAADLGYPSGSGDLAPVVSRAGGGVYY